MEYCSAIKKNETMPFVVAWMNLEIFKDKDHMTWLICKSKNDTNELIYKTETDSDIENKFIVTKGKGGGGIN